VAATAYMIVAAMRADSPFGRDGDKSVTEVTLVARNSEVVPGDGGGMQDLLQLRDVGLGGVDVKYAMGSQAASLEWQVGGDPDGGVQGAWRSRGAPAVGGRLKAWFPWTILGWSRFPLKVLTFSTWTAKLSTGTTTQCATQKRRSCLDLSLALYRESSFSESRFAESQSGPL
jgi:hypothetical protein